MLKNAELIVEHYGYVPSFHDAHLLALRYRMRNRSLLGEFYVYDMANEGKWRQDWDTTGDLHMYVTLRWNDVFKLDYLLGNNAIHQMEFKGIEDGVETSFTDQETFLDCKIFSASVEVISAQVVEERYARGNEVAAGYFRPLDPIEITFEE
jgi:Immunity protein 50